VRCEDILNHAKPLYACVQKFTIHNSLFPSQADVLLRLIRSPCRGGAAKLDGVFHKACLTKTNKIPSAVLDGYVFGPRGSGVERKPFEFPMLDCEVQLAFDLLAFGPVTAGEPRIEARLQTAYFHSTDPEIGFCDGYVCKQATLTASSDLLAEVSVDAVEPSLVDGAVILCLSQAKYPDSQG
jgi:hypothetical protein